MKRLTSLPPHTHTLSLYYTLIYSAYFAIVHVCTVYWFFGGTKFSHFFYPKLNNPIYRTSSLYLLCLSLPLILPFSICHLCIICLLLFFSIFSVCIIFPFSPINCVSFFPVGVVSSGSSLDTEEADCIVHQGKEGSLQICKPLNFVFDAFLLRSEMHLF